MQWLQCERMRYAGAEREDYYSCFIKCLPVADFFFRDVVFDKVFVRGNKATIRPVELR